MYKMFDRKDISERLKAAREALPNKVNPTQFAKKGKGIDESQYIKFEKGGAMGNKKIMELCSVWGISVDWVYRGEGGMFAKELPPSAPPSKEKPSPSRDRVKGIEERIKEIDNRTIDLESNLGTVQDTQNWISGLVGEILNILVKQLAGGSQEKENEILDELSKKIGPDLPAFLKTGIRADGHKTGMGNSYG